jgi:hypothetical protein
VTKDTEKTGMLWFDSTENESKNKKLEVRTEREKILRAIEYYTEKYGLKVTEIHINPNSIFSLKKDAIEGILVVKDKSIPPNHIWLTT